MRGKKDEVEKRGAVAEDSPRRRGGAEKSRGRSGDLVIARDRVIGKALKRGGTEKENFTADLRR